MQVGVGMIMSHGVCVCCLKVEYIQIRIGMIMIQGVYKFKNSPELFCCNGT